MPESERREFQHIPPCTPFPDRQIKEPDPFQQRLDAILMRQLTPENINTYATDALEQVVGLVDNVVSLYHPKETEVHKTDLERENAAFHHYGLPNINNILDHIQTVSEELSTIDDVIAHIPKADEIHVPPDDVTVTPLQGTGTEPITEKRKIPRLKTLLFVVSQDFDTDIQDPQQVSISPGAVHERMMRQEGYVLVDIPGIQRASLVCDEEGNVTYVFNTQELTSLDKTPEDMATFSKSEINSFLEEHPAAGQRIVYSELFVKNLNAALEMPHYVVNGGNGNTPSTTDTTSPADRSATYLYPKAPEGYKSVSALARSIGIASRTVDSALSALEGELGEIRIARFHSNLVRALSPEQQELVKQHLVHEGYLSGKAPEEYKSVIALAQSFGVSNKTVAAAISALEGELGEIGIAKFGRTTTKALSPEQQELIRQHLERNGYLVEKTPEGFTSIRGMALLFGVSDKSVKAAISALEGELGEITKASFRGTVAMAFSPHQQELIRQHLDQEGYLVDKAPEGYVSLYALARSFGVTHSTVAAAIKALKGELGEIGKAKFGSNYGRVLSPHQQELIRQYLEGQTNLIEKAPEGYLSVNSITKNIGFAKSTLQRIIHSLGSQLGPPIKADFHGNITSAYSPEQVEMIKRAYEDRKK